MSLGVLNNLSAVYAENSLNNSNNSLNTVLQQLSSGSKINSGADDAAGLSLVNGLQANQQALTQSGTNATEGVGLLQVADGALSQVTSLLNRAVTLATEASNGTLNSSQDTAANQEYQSILSEISNIGSTTTYNDAAVFNSLTNIYTGDSSTTGSSINTLNIRTLSSSNVGDSGGAMAYSNGANNVFVNLSTSTANAAVSDSLSGSATTINVNYLVKGSGTESTATTSISTGGTTGFANTAGGLISAINNSGLGLTASFATQAQAGVQGGGSETGIQITGGLVSAGFDPSTASTSGVLDLTGLAPTATLALGATVTVNQGAQSNAFVIGSTNNTLANLATAINNYTTAHPSFAVNASVVTNGDGTQSLALADAGPTGGALNAVITNGSGTTQAPIFAASVGGSTVAVQTPGATVTGTAYAASLASTITVGTTNGPTGIDIQSEQLTEGTSITIQNAIANDTQLQTFVVGNGTDINTSTGTHYTGAVVDSGTGGNTLGNLADTINAQSGTLGVFASIGANGLTITTGTFVSGNYATSGTGTTVVGTPTTLTGQNVSVTANNLTSATSGTALGLYAPTMGGAAGGGSPTITDLDSNGNPALQSDVLSGHITLNDPQNTGGAVTFTMNGTTDTWTTLMTDINNSTLGVSAAWGATLGGAGSGGLQLTATSNGVNTVAVTVNTLADTVGGPFNITKDAGGTGIAPGVAGNTTGTASTAILQLATGDITDGTTTLGGAVTINYRGVAQTFIMGSAPAANPVGSAIYTGGTSVTSLINAINASAMGGVTNTLYAKGVTAADNAGGGGTGGVYLQGATGIAAGGTNAFTLTAIVPTGGTETPLSATSALSVGGVPGGGSQTVTVLDTGAAVTGVGDFLSGSFTLKDLNPTNGNVAQTFTMDGTTTTWQTLANEIAASNLGLNAVFTSNANGTPGDGGLVLTSTTNGVDTVTIGGAGITDNSNTIVKDTAGTGHAAGVAQALTATGTTAATGAVGNNAVDNITSASAVSTSDIMAGGITITNGSITDQFVVGPGANVPTGSSRTYYTGSTGNDTNTLANLATTINADSGHLGVTAQANAAGLTLTQTGGVGTYTGATLSTSLNTLTDVTGGTFATSTTTNATMLANESDTLSGALVFNVGTGGATQTVTMAQVAAANSEATSKATATQLISYINTNSTALGVSAAWVPAGGGSTFGSIQLTSGTEGSAGTVNVSSTLTSLVDTTAGSALNYTAKSAYNTGLSGSITDTNTTAAATYASNTKTGSGTATISYTDAAGVSLSATDLSNQNDAQGALTLLNSAITSVAAQDGYIGAQINTLNSVSQVLSTQSENVQSAQNAVQATDYASATSNMSKYEILSQTGIAALAQANTVQQEVLKLI